MKPFATASAIVLLAGLSLSACSTDLKHGLCPSASVLSNTSDLTAFKDNMAGDPTGLLYEVGMMGVVTDCSFNTNEGTADSSMSITLRATRPASGTAAQYLVPFYVAVTRDSTTIVSKNILSAPFAFEAGEVSTTFTVEVPSTLVRLDNGKKPYDYGLLTGLQMTQAQLDYNKKIGRFGP